jgi:SAM-dependent methyltransferase
MSDLQALYAKRFPHEDRAAKERVWRVLCSSFFQGYVPEDSVVLDLGPGFCEFLNNIHARERIGVDLSDEAARHAATGVQIRHGVATDLSFLPDGSVDVVFASNFFEHLRSKEQVLGVLQESLRVLRPGGRLLVLQPNLRYVRERYWDFFDHVTPLTHRSMEEALVMAGFHVQELRPRFLPYTTRSRLPQWPWLVRLYLGLPFLHRIFGGQMFVLATKARG